MRILSSVSVLALAAFSISTALAADPAAPPMKMPPQMQMQQGGPEAMAKMCAAQIASQGKLVDEIAVRLALTDKQKPLYETWKKIHMENMTARPCPGKRPDPQMSTPERMEFDEEMLSHAVDALHKEVPAIKALYAVLTPDQKESFENPPPPKPEASKPEMVKPEAKPPAKPESAPAKPATPPAH